jgi:NAD(P)-dependent dehydrogenase (short-subunit alcohol dehydrogenase family)
VSISIFEGGLGMEFNFDSTAEDVTEGLDFTGQNWLVTGCNSGLGLETMRVLAMRGAHIWAAARTEEKAKQAIDSLGITGTPVACELSDLDSVRKAVSFLKNQNQQFKGIIANAGIMALPVLHQQNGIELQFFTNHVGHFLLITELCDSLTEDGRVVVLSSGAHYYSAESGLELENLSGEQNYNDWRMYGRSKLANILFANALQKRFEGSNRTANSVHPGVIRTNLARHVENVEEMFENLKTRVTLKSIAQGAATQCLVATRPELEGIGGHYFSDCQISKTASIAQDENLAEALWKVSLDLIK